MPNYEALLRVADILDTVKPERFNLSQWVEDRAEPQGLFIRALRKIGLIDPVCGTSACAIGYAASNKWFRGRGFRLMSTDGRGFYPFYKGYTGFSAVAIFFNIDHDSAWHLFHPESYQSSTPKDVADRIRRFVSDERKAGLVLR